MERWLSRALVAWVDLVRRRARAVVVASSVAINVHLAGKSTTRLVRGHEPHQGVWGGLTLTRVGDAERLAREWWEQFEVRKK